MAVEEEAMVVDMVLLVVYMAEKLQVLRTKFPSVLFWFG